LNALSWSRLSFVSFVIVDLNSRSYIEEYIYTVFCYCEKRDVTQEGVVTDIVV